MKNVGVKIIIFIMFMAVALTGCGKSLPKADEVIIREPNFDREKPVVGVAWRGENPPSNVIKAIENAGGKAVYLDEVTFNGIVYENNEFPKQYMNEDGSLSSDICRRMWRQSYDSTAASVLYGINAVVFSGGEDISPALYKTGNEVATNEKNYNARRDISDFLTMTYCLDHNISVLGICRGMQMLSVASGAELIQEMGDYYAEKGMVYTYCHRPFDTKYGAYCRHEVVIKDKTSRYYEIIGEDVVCNVPSWHHQAVKSVENTNLKASAFSYAGGVEIIEAVERCDKYFAVGVQYHPEITVVRHNDVNKREAETGDFEKARAIFIAIVERAKSSSC